LISFREKIFFEGAKKRPLDEGKGRAKDESSVLGKSPKGGEKRGGS